MHQNDKTGQRLRSMFNGHMLLNFKYIFCCCEFETTTRKHYIGAIFSNNKCTFVFVWQYLTIYKINVEYYEKIKPKHLQWWKI